MKIYCGISRLQEIRSKTSSPQRIWSPKRPGAQVIPLDNRSKYQSQHFCKKCSPFGQRNGFPFSKKEWNCLEKWPHYSSKPHPQWRFQERQNSHNSWHPWHGPVALKEHSSMAEQQKGMASQKDQGKASQKDQGKEPQKFQDRKSHCSGREPSPILENPLQSFSFQQHVIHSRLWQPPNGSVKPLSGRVCRSMDPSWVISNASGPRQASSGCPQGPFFKRLQRSLPWWEKNTTNPKVLQLIKYGVHADHPIPSKLSKVPCIRTEKETQLAWETVQEYLEVGALKEIQWAEAQHLIPWFVIQKGEKLRLITNCKEINHYLEPKPFRLENWPEIFPFLRKGLWAAKIDLKHAYFHLGIAQQLQPYICIQVEQKVFQFQAACFGMSTLPQQWQSVMKVFLKKWRKQGFLTWVYLDDILLVGASPQAVQKHLASMLKDLEQLAW